MPILTTIFSLLIVRRIMRILGTLVLLSILWVVLLRFVSPVPGVQVVSATFGGGAEREWVTYDEMNVHVMKAAIVAHDETFLNHWGFDFRGVGLPMKVQQQREKALLKGELPKMKLPGQQTITQQVASQVFVGHGQSWVRTVFRGYFTLLVELFWPKKRILEVYLNSLPVGKQQFGVQQASLTIFEKPVQALSAFQSAALFANLPRLGEVPEQSVQSIALGMQKLPAELFPADAPEASPELTDSSSGIDTQEADDPFAAPPAPRAYQN